MSPPYKLGIPEVAGLPHMLIQAIQQMGDGDKIYHEGGDFVAQLSRAMDYLEDQAGCCAEPFRSSWGVLSPRERAMLYVQAAQEAGCVLSQWGD